jgi:hypothetical protein
MQQKIDKTISGYLKVLDNQYVSTAITLALILYAGVAAPKLPESMAKLLDNSIVKLLLFILIAFIAKKNITIAIVAAIGVMVTLQTLTRHRVNNQMIKVINGEAVSVSVSPPVLHEEQLPLVVQMTKQLAESEAKLTAIDIPSEEIGVVSSTNKQMLNVGSYDDERNYAYKEMSVESESMLSNSVPSSDGVDLREHFSQSNNDNSRFNHQYADNNDVRSTGSNLITGFDSGDNYAQLD